ncbi:MAG: NAD-dependent epimerase [Campylobacterales bacterium]|nr:NAD-dependent epimerase [Campylobacterales bacterium]
MKILVTGTAGFIGFHLAKKLLERGDEIVGLDNINDYYDPNLKYARLEALGIQQEEIADNQIANSHSYPKHRFIKADLADKNTIDRLFEEESFDAVCHLAAQAGVRYSLENPYAYIDSNILGFMNILEACRNFKVKNLSYASSSSVYGLNQSQPFKVSDHTDHPVSLYAATKKSNEMMAHTYAHLYGIQTTGLRFFTVYGPWGRPDMAPMLFSDAIFHKRSIKVFNFGDMSRDFTYIDDIVNGVVNVIDNPAQPNEEFDPKNPDPSISSAPYKLYNIGNNAPVDLMEFISTLENVIGEEAQKEFLPMQDGDVVSTYADTSGLIHDFNYKPNTLLQKGIEEFVKWYREFYKC